VFITSIPHTLRLLRGTDPLGSQEFATLRTLKRLLARGGLPPQSCRTPADEARIAAFFTLQELLYILNEFRNAHLRGARCRLAVSENGRSAGKITIEIALLEEEDRPHDGAASGPEPRAGKASP
jgi:hypothetical protein